MNATSQQTTLNFSYSYDGNGNITDIVRTERSGDVVSTPTPVSDDEPVTMTLGGDRIVTSYTYDAAGQLLEAIDGETDHIYRYTYDNSGNIRSAKTYVYDDDGNEVLSESKTFGYNNGILASYTDGTSTVTYQTDAMGNPIRISGGGVIKTLSWGEGRMLLGVSTNASNYSQYTYDVDGLRTRKVVAVNGIKTTTEYAWGDNGLAGIIIRDATATTTVIPHYDSAGEAIGFTVKRVPTQLSSPSTTNTYTYVKNLQGDVLRILDSNGNAVVNYTYDPWGKPTVTGDEELAALNPCSYRGYDYDEETGYYYLQSRYYDPQIGRFINCDSVSYLGASQSPLSFNLYLYCDNSWIMGEDPCGNGPILAYGFQFVVSVGNFTGGIECLWKHSNKKFYVFAFAGGSSAKKQISNKYSQIVSKIVSALKKLTKISFKNIKKLPSIAVSVLVVLGNKHVSFPKNYSGWFTGISASGRNLVLSGARAVSGKKVIGSIGFGITSKRIGTLDFSQTFYLQLNKVSDLRKYLNSLRTDVLNSVEWLKLFVSLFT